MQIPSYSTLRPPRHLCGCFHNFHHGHFVSDVKQFFFPRMNFHRNRLGLSNFRKINPVSTRVELCCLALVGVVWLGKALCSF